MYVRRVSCIGESITCRLEFLIVFKKMTNVFGKVAIETLVLCLGSHCTEVYLTINWSRNKILPISEMAQPVRSSKFKFRNTINDCSKLNNISQIKLAILICMSLLA